MMTTAMRPVRTLGAIVLSAILGLGPLAASAEAGDFLAMTESDGQMLFIDFTATSVLVANPAVADVQLVSDSSLFIYGKTPGRTKLIILDQNGEVAFSRFIMINRSLSKMPRLGSGA